jgi:hypothetical protein
MLLGFLQIQQGPNGHESSLPLFPSTGLDTEKFGGI